jgi:hypothetical protein
LPWEKQLVSKNLPEQNSPLFEIALVLAHLDHVARQPRGDGKRFVVRADKRLTAFLEVESAIRAGSIRKKGLVIIRATIVNDLTY